MFVILWIINLTPLTAVGGHGRQSRGTIALLKPTWGALKNDSTESLFLFEKIYPYRCIPKAFKVFHRASGLVQKLLCEASHNNLIIPC